MRWIRSLVRGSGRDQLCMAMLQHSRTGLTSMLPNFPSGSKRSTAFGPSRRLHAGMSVSDDFHQHSFAAPAVEFAVKNLFPWAKIQPAVRDGDDDFPPHHLPFDVSIAVVLASLIVLIHGIMRRDTLQKAIVICKQTLLVIVDVDARGNVHGIDQHETFLHTAVLDDRFDLPRDIDIRAAGLGFEPELFTVRSHSGWTEG